MIPISQLRTGNIVLCDKKLHPVAMINIIHNEIWLAHLDNKGFFIGFLGVTENDIEPAPITHKRLINCGFECHEVCVGNTHNYTRKEDGLKLNTALPTWFFLNGDCIGKEIEYMHQLQNIYFHKTGNELVEIEYKIKKDDKISRLTYSGEIHSLSPSDYYVCGTNTQGRHGLGGARIAAKNFGAIYGQAKGVMGQTYGIITKDLTKKIHPSISKEFIIEQIKELYEFALTKPDSKFYIIYSGVGKNLNAYTPNEMAQMFACINDIPNNIVFEENFNGLIEKLI